MAAKLWSQETWKLGNEKPSDHQPNPITPKSAGKKPFVIAGVAIVALVSLSMLLFFMEDVFVGEAIKFDQTEIPEGEAGVFLLYDPVQAAGTQVEVPIMAHFTEGDISHLQFKFVWPQTTMKFVSFEFSDSLKEKMVIDGNYLTTIKTIDGEPKWASGISYGGKKVTVAWLQTDELGNGLSGETFIGTVVFDVEEEGDAHLEFPYFNYYDLSGNLVEMQTSDVVFTAVANEYDACYLNTFEAYPGSLSYGSNSFVEHFDANSCFKQMSFFTGAENIFVPYSGTYECVEIYKGIPITKVTTTNLELYQPLSVWNGMVHHGVGKSACSQTMLNSTYVEGDNAYYEDGFTSLDALRACIDEGMSFKNAPYYDASVSCDASGKITPECSEGEVLFEDECVPEVACETLGQQGCSANGDDLLCVPLKSGSYCVSPGCVDAVFTVAQGYQVSDFCENSPADFVECGLAQEEGYCGGDVCFANDDFTTISLACPELPVNPTCQDVDGDGYNATGGSCGIVDCDDNDTTVWEEMELYQDVDEDGVYSNESTLFCTNGVAGENYTTSQGTDCNDTDASVWQLVNVYPDNDGDGLGQYNDAHSFCVNDSVSPSDLLENGTLNGNDCDDTDTSITSGDCPMFDVCSESNLAQCLTETQCQDDGNGVWYLGTCYASASLLAADAPGVIVASDNLAFDTIITNVKGEDINDTLVIFVKLTDQDGNLLKLVQDSVEGLAAGESYTSTVVKELPLGILNVTKKVVVVDDWVNPTVALPKAFEKTYVVG